METSTTFKASHQPLPSPDGLHVASITSSRLQVRSTTSLDVFRSISLPIEENARIVSVRWSRTTQSQLWSYRVLIADGDNVRIWDLRDPKWTATINNGSGGMGKIVSADFGSNMDEVLIFSDFCSKATVWSLVNGRSVEIRDTKYPSSKGYAFRPAGEGSPSIMALLTRPGPQDVLTLHAPRSYKVLKTIQLATHDAQGLKWSPDGRWVAIWDSPSVGSRFLIYTADGYLYRMDESKAGHGEELALGVRSLEWSPSGNCLAVGRHDRMVSLLSTRTFSPTVVLEHTSTVQLPNARLWQENVSASALRAYGPVSQPVSPPLLSTSSSGSGSKVGISSLAFNVDGSLLATKDEAAPTAIWIWDITTMRPVTVLLQHSPVKKLSWHPTRPELLLIQSVHDEPVVYLWSATDNFPVVLSAPLERSGGKVEVNWLPTRWERKPGFVVSNTNAFVLLWPDGRDPPLEEDELEDSQGGDQSLDSVVEMLAGRTPLPDHVQANEWANTMEVEDDYTDTAFEDTFRAKRPLGVA